MAGPIKEVKGSAIVTLKVQVGEKEKEVKAYKAEAEIYASEKSDGSCNLTVYDVNSFNREKRVYSEDIKKKEGEEYLKALLWTEKCSNGIHIMYYTPK